MQSSNRRKNANASNSILGRQDEQHCRPYKEQGRKRSSAGWQEKLASLKQTEEADMGTTEAAGVVAEAEGAIGTIMADGEREKETEGEKARRKKDFDDMYFHRTSSKWPKCTFDHCRPASNHQITCQK